MIDIEEYDPVYWAQVVKDDPYVEGVTPRSGLSRLLKQNMDDPMVRWAKARARAQHERAIHLRCAFGNCTILWDPVRNIDMGGMGPAGCPCESLHGWSKKHLDQRPRPRMAVKAIGRNGSRVKRSQRRQAGIGKSGLMKWAEEYRAHHE